MLTDSIYKLYKFTHLLHLIPLLHSDWGRKANKTQINCTKER